MTNPCNLAIEFLRDELEFREMATKSRMGASFQPGYAEKTESIKQAIALLDQSAPPTPGEEERLSAFQTIVDFIYGFSEGANNPKTDKALCVIKAALAPPQPANVSRPKIVCFCGSVRFSAQMLVVAWEYAKAGLIVLGWCVLPDSYFEAHPGSAGDDEAGVHAAEREGVKEALDELHKRKIDLADEVLVINVGGYVGDSTKSEICYALKHRKPIRWLEPESSGVIIRSIYDGVKEGGKRA